jgi:hypothetical protein
MNKRIFESMSKTSSFFPIMSFVLSVFVFGAVTENVWAANYGPEHDAHLHHLIDKKGIKAHHIKKAQKKDIKGKYVVFSAIDPVTQSEVQTGLLFADDGQVSHLVLADDQTLPPSQSQVTLQNALQVDHEVADDAHKEVLQKSLGPVLAPSVVASDNLQAEALAEASPSAGTRLVQDLTVYFISYQDVKSSFSPTDLTKTMLPDLNEFFLRHSYGQFSWTGQGYNVTLPVVSTAAAVTACDYNFLYTTVVAGVQTAATAAGLPVPKSGYTMYVLPTNNGCGWAGLGEVGNVGVYPGGGVTWVNNMINISLLAHEVGHNFGLMHGNLLNCSANTATNGSLKQCVSEEYQDPMETMGYGWNFFGSFNVAYKEIMNWLNQPDLPQIQTVTEPGTYTIEALDGTSNQVKGLKLLRVSKDPDFGGVDTYYYLEYRVPGGIDGVNQDYYTPAQNQLGLTMTGVMLRIYNTSTHYANFISVDPGSTHVGMQAGATYEDPLAFSGGLKITVLSLTSKTAQVQIERTGAATGTAVCQTGAVTLTPPSSTSVVAASGLTELDFTLVNTDQNCPARTISVIKKAAVAGFTVQVPVLTTLASGQTAVVKVLVAPVSASKAASGELTVVVKDVNKAVLSSAETALSFTPASTATSSATSSSADFAVKVTPAKISVSASSPEVTFAVSKSASGPALLNGKVGAPIVVTIHQPDASVVTLNGTGNKDGSGASVKLSLHQSSLQGHYLYTVAVTTTAGVLTQTGSFNIGP